MEGTDRAESAQPLVDAARRYVPRGVRRATRGFALVLVLLASLYVLEETWGQFTWTQPISWSMAYLAFVVTLRAIGANPVTVYRNGAVMVVAIVVGTVGR